MPLDAAVVLGLSPDALHVWRADPMVDHVGDHLGHVPLSRITAMTVTPGRSWQKLSISLDGGQQVNIEARGASHALAAAFDKVKAAIPQDKAGPVIPFARRRSTWKLRTTGRLRAARKEGSSCARFLYMLREFTG